MAKKTGKKTAKKTAKKKTAKKAAKKTAKKPIPKARIGLTFILYPKNKPGKAADHHGRTRFKKKAFPAIKRNKIIMVVYSI